MKHLKAVSKAAEQPAMAASSLAVKLAYIELLSEFVGLLADIKDLLGIGSD